MPEISIIIPVYNKEKYIDKCLNCIIKQNFKDYECIIIDDGSKDNSGEICDRIARYDKRFIVKHTKNYGVSHARNIGLDVSSGKYITFIDGDDIIEEDYLSKLYSGVSKNSVDLSIGSIVKYWEGINEYEKIEMPIGKFKFADLLEQFSMIQKQSGVFGYCCGKIIKRDLAIKARFNERIGLAEDLEYYLRIYPYIDNIYFDNNCEYIYIQQAENSWSRLDDDKINYLSQIEVNLVYREFLLKMNVYEKNNKKDVDTNISNYVFFALFHADRGQIDIIGLEIVKLLNGLPLEEKGTTFMKKIILYLFERQNWKCIRHILLVYDNLRNVKVFIKGKRI